MKLVSCSGPWLFLCWSIFLPLPVSPSTCYFKQDHRAVSPVYSFCLFFFFSWNVLEVRYGSNPDLFWMTHGTPSQCMWDQCNVFCWKWVLCFLHVQFAVVSPWTSLCSKLSRCVFVVSITSLFPGITCPVLFPSLNSSLLILMCPHSILPSWFLE